jgi:tRNA pseudouridine55 synthase
VNGSHADAFAGILLLDKPLGISSNRALQTVRRMLGAEKAGHVGSLDPLATGMLPICLGEATKIAGEILSGRKRYEFTIKLGIRRSTGDAEGEVIETKPVRRLEEPRVAEVLSRFEGRQEQIPPMYSALKKDGQPLYKLARAGKEVDRAPRSIEIFDLVLRGIDDPESLLRLETTCSKGTYIRVLAEDVARALGSCGYVAKLRRTWVEPFEGEPMQTLEEAEKSPRILPADRGVPHLPSVNLSAEETRRLRQGQAVQAGANRCGGELTGEHAARLYDEAGRFFGLGTVEEAGIVRPRRLWSSPARLVAGTPRE